MLYETIAVSIFTRTGAHDTTGSWIHSLDIAFVLQILEQKRDCSQSKSIATNEFFFLDTTRNATVSGTNQLAKRRAEYNKGFPASKALLGTSSTVNTEISMNRYSFFEALENKLLPNTN